MILLERIRKGLLHTVYPAKCFHCSSSLPSNPPYLCQTCASHLDLIQPHGRCPFCFQFLEEGHIHCSKCHKTSNPYFRIGAALDYTGPVTTLVKHLKYYGKPYLAKGMAAFMFAQFDIFKWPMPDVLIPVPQSWMHRLERGYNQSTLLAEEMGRFLNCPVLHALKRRSGHFSQAALSLEQRKQLSTNQFKRNLKHSFEGKKLLVIDDVMTSGLTLKRCGEALMEGNPEVLYALTFSHTGQE